MNQVVKLSVLALNYFFVLDLHILGSNMIAEIMNSYHSKEKNILTKFCVWGMCILTLIFFKINYFTFFI